jgi:pimeloyl-ACP methyl ester carboxylesterase
VEDYDHVELAADVVALLDALGLERAVIVGHDWGAPVAWHTALLHPERVSAVVAMSVPYGGRAPARPLDIMRRRAGDSFFYMLHFQEPGVAEAELEADVPESLRRFYYSCSGDAPPGSFLTPKPRTASLFEAVTAPPGLPRWLSEEDLAHYTASFRESGFFGPLNWYRNIDRTWERTAFLEGKKVAQKALFIAGDRDPVLLFNQRATERMATVVPGLVGTRILPGVGHWTQQEDPSTVNAELITFLRST